MALDTPLKPLGFFSGAGHAIEKPKGFSVKYFKSSLSIHISNRIPDREGRIQLLQYLVHADGRIAEETRMDLCRYAPFKAV